ncbi:MAG: hypothetical protein EZS28_005917 [Streblomastix strix]|uniref:Uncharacterized protein n=1 Tax=Streblomastix strix TaxID=222440 RepID=A0A5J4WW22_9EUKA|nr:MAG: hypothetical protein EZS28_005917 [Streblomastix strix]
MLQPELHSKRRNRSQNIKSPDLVHHRVGPIIRNIVGGSSMNIESMDMKTLSQARARLPEVTNTEERTQGNTKIKIQMEQHKTLPSSTNINLRQCFSKNEIRQSTGDIYSTDLAGTIVVHQTKEFIHQIPIPWIVRQSSGDGTENERQGSKTSTRQCGCLPSGPVADVGRDLLMRFMKMRGFSEDGVSLLFKDQRFNTIKRNFYSTAQLQDWLNRQRITIEEMMKKDAKVILTEVIAFLTRQNNSVASAESYKDYLIAMLSLIQKENLTTSTTSKLINKAFANATIPHRRYQNIWNIQILFNHWRQLKQNKYLYNYDLQVKIASLLMSVCFFKPNEIAEIRLKFSNVSKTENQASLRLAPKQANAIETYEVYETDNEKLCPKLAIYEWIDRLKKQFPKDTDFFIEAQRELKIIGASSYSIRHSELTELAKLELMTQQNNQRIFKARIIMKGQVTYLNKEVRQGEKGVTNNYPRLLERQSCDFLDTNLLISPQAQPKFVSLPDVKQQ